MHATPTSSPLARAAARGFAAALALCTATLMQSCNVAVPVAYAITGPPQVDAVTELDAKRPTVILVDDPASKMPRRELRQVLGSTADAELLKAKVFPDGKLIASRSALAASGTGSLGAGAPKLSVVDVGRRVGAEVVVYAEVLEWTLVSDGQSISPAATMSVRVIDALSNQRIFPTESEHIVVARLQAGSGYKEGDRPLIEKALANQMGLDLARVFFRHPRTQLQDQRPQRLSGPSSGPLTN